MRITYILILFFLPLLLSAQTTENDQVQLKKSKVQSITIMGASLDEFGNANAIRSKKEYRKYNINGQLIQEIIYDAQSAIISNTNFLYNKDNQVTKYMVKDASGNTIKRQACNFENGNKISCEGVEDSQAYKLNYKYDALGNQIERKKIINDIDTAFLCKVMFEGKTKIAESCDGNPTINIEYQYDSTGRLIAKNTFTNIFLSFNFIYHYNSKNQLIEETKYDANGVQIERLVYDYIDEKITKSISKYNQSDRLVMLWKYFYDNKDNIQFIKIYEGENKAPLYQSEYIYKYHQ